MVDELSRRSTISLLGAAVAGAGPSGRPAETTRGGAGQGAAGVGMVRGIDVRAHGAVADDRTDNAAAFDRAVAAGIASGRPVFLPAATAGYATSRPLRPATGLVGEGRGSVIRALPGFRGEAIVHVGWKRADNPALCTVPLGGFRVVGAATRPARPGTDPAAIGFAAAGILFDESAAFIHMVDVGAEFCRKGIVHATINGHIGGTALICSNNWYNLYWECNTGDYRYVDCVFTGAFLATYGCHGSRRDDLDVGGIVALATFGCHGGFSPYLFYQEDGDGTVGLVAWTSINSSAEQIGNQVIRLGRTTAGARRNCSGWFVVAPGHSWTVPGTPDHAVYAITGDPAAPEQRYAVDLDLVQGGGITIQGLGWVAGRSGRHTRVADLLDWVADDNGIGGYEVTGGGRERLTCARAPRLRQSRKLTGTPRAGEVARFDVPPSYDNTPGGRVSWSLAYRARTAQPATLRLRVRVDGAPGTPEQELTPQVVGNGVGNLSGFSDVDLGRRDRARDVHGVRLIVEVPAGVELQMLEGTLTLEIGQDTGVVR